METNGAQEKHRFTCACFVRFVFTATASLILAIVLSAICLVYASRLTGLDSVIRRILTKIHTVRTGCHACSGGSALKSCKARGHKVWSLQGGIANSEATGMWPPVP